MFLWNKNGIIEKYGKQVSKSKLFRHLYYSSKHTCIEFLITSTAYLYSCSYTQILWLFWKVYARVCVSVIWEKRGRACENSHGTTGTCFIQKIYAPSSSLHQGKHLPFSPSPLRLNIFRLFVILSLTQLYRYTPEIFLFTTATFKYTYRAPLRRIGQEYQRT
jgi:hypothetical protein